ncbi:MAG: hypothetical protein SPI35_00480 [Porphyromonas sp.]|nr:hypothetical protein [Porphyromonas sp.]
MKKKVYQSPEIQCFCLQTQKNALGEFSMQGTVRGFEGVEEDDF